MGPVATRPRPPGGPAVVGLTILKDGPLPRIHNCPSACFRGALVPDGIVLVNNCLTDSCLRAGVADAGLSCLVQVLQMQPAE